MERRTFLKTAGALGLSAAFGTKAFAQGAPEKAKVTLGVGGDWGAVFRYADEGTEDPYSLLSPFKQETDYMAPSTAGFMINLRVDDLDAMIAQLEAKGIEILGRQDEDYGNFAWILDCDGIKLELWQQKGAAPA